MRMSKRMMNETAKDILTAFTYEIANHRKSAKSGEQEFVLENMEDRRKHTARCFIMLGILTVAEAEECMKRKVSKAVYDAISTKPNWLSATAKLRGSQFAVEED